MYLILLCCAVYLEYSFCTNTEQRCPGFCQKPQVHRWRAAVFCTSPDFFSSGFNTIGLDIFSFICLWSYLVTCTVRLKSFLAHPSNQLSYKTRGCYYTRSIISFKINLCTSYFEDNNKTNKNSLGTLSEKDTYVTWLFCSVVETWQNQIAASMDVNLLLL